MSDIGLLSLNRLASPTKSTFPSSTAPSVPNPTRSSTLPIDFANPFGGPSSEPRRSSPFPLTPLHGQVTHEHRPSSTRIPSSTSQSDLLRLPSNINDSPLRKERLLSRSNSSPRPRRRVAQASLDLGDSTHTKFDLKVGDDERRRMKRWIAGFVVINFDLDIGPVLERSIPDRRWHVGVGENIAFSSFPDTTLFNEGQTTWSYKINDERKSPHSALDQPRPSATSFTELTSSNGQVAEELNPNGGEGGGLVEGRLFGYVLFLQRRDNTVKRGYFQKSLVLLSPLPYPSLFIDVVSFLAPRFFKDGPAVLAAACKQIASWPAPSPSASLSLPLFDTTFHVELPTANQSSQFARSIPPSLDVDPHTYILASLPKTPPLRLLAHVLPSLWLIWECLIMAEPLLVIAPDPKSCSELVWWLRDFIRPLPPSGDIRPYFHIHEASFPLLVNSHQPPPGTILGVTNPFFRQACSHWQHVLSSINRVDAAPKMGQGSDSRANALASKGDIPNGFKSKRKRQIDKDPALLKRLEATVLAGNGEDVAANNELRFHFAGLTEKFLVPLNRYFGSLIPTDLHPDGNNNLPPLKPFSTPAFLASLKSHGHPLTFRSKVAGGSGSQAFYAEWLKSRHFGAWLARRCGEAVEEMEKRARAAGWQGPIARGGAVGYRPS